MEGKLKMEEDMSVTNCLAVVIVIFLALPVFSQNTNPDTFAADSVFSLKLTPGIGIPFGRDTEIFTLGGGADFLVQYQIPLSSRLDWDLQAEIGYNLMPTVLDSSVSTLTFGVGTGVSWEFIPRFIASGYIRGGYFSSFLNSTSGLDIDSSEETGGGNPYLGLGASFTFMLFPTVGVGLDTSYRSYLGYRNSMRIALAASYHLPSGRSGEAPVREEGKQRTRPELLEKEVVNSEKEIGVEIENLAFESIFPVFFKYYDEHPLGKATIHNWEEVPIKDVKIDLFIKSYMDNPKRLILSEPLEPGERRDIELYGLLTDKVLEVSEGTKVSASITVEYDINEEPQKRDYIETIRIHNRNAITWDDDRKAAAFVTAKDSTILRFSKNIVAMIKDKGNRTINRNLLAAIGLHEALSLYGMSYVIDPTTPYKEFSKDKLSLDFLQFPSQTLDYKAGDCDDLSILYSALFESVGVETAFITIPGHIFMAFSLDMEPDEARQKFIHPDDLILEDDKAWLPVEVTLIGDGFLKAWETGAREWRENESKGQAGFFPMHEAWKMYEPVGFMGGEQSAISLPPEDELVGTCIEETNRFVEQEIGPRVFRLHTELSRSQGNWKVRNKLGVLYARYGLDDMAEEQFREILLKDEYFPVLLNMGNLCFLRDDMDQALEYFEKAATKAPDNPKVLLCLARANHALENYGTSRRTYEKLKELDPELAARFSYLDLRGKEADRAAELSKTKEVVIWEEE